MTLFVKMLTYKYRLYMKINLRNILLVIACVLLLWSIFIIYSKSYTVNKKGRFSKKHINNAEIIIPRKVKLNGEHAGYKLLHDSEENVHYSVFIEGIETHLELKPNKRLMLRNITLENRGNGVNITTSIWNNNLCHYSGIVKGNKESKVALSNCFGLAGFIFVNNLTYFIEPLDTEHDITSENKHEHIVYKNGRSEEDFFCYLGHKKRRMKRDTKHFQKRKSKLGSTKMLYLETLIVLDKSLIEFHKSLDLENYVLTILNMAHNLFRDATFGAPLEFVVVRIIRLVAEDDQLNLAATREAPKVLDAFKAWAKRANPNSETHPSHHDLAVLITRVDICMEPDSQCGVVGLANLASTCDPDEQAAIVEDNGLKCGFTIAHEIGHTLGLMHDTPEETTCDPKPYGDGYSTVMAPHTTMKARGWSGCSRDALHAYLDSGLGECLYDQPAEHTYRDVNMLPGAMYGVDFQCTSYLGPPATGCGAVECNNLKCKIKVHGCVSTDYPLAEGTACGDKMWCFNGACVKEGQMPKSVSGDWSAWGDWSSCSTSCSRGIRTRTRRCDNPAPQNGGKYCRGKRTHYSLCNANDACPESSLSSRDVQCKEFDDWVYPEDGQKHKWQTFLKTTDDPCALVCINELKQPVVLKSKVNDGTSCFLGPNHICIVGQCKEIPCDNILSSKAVEDACGICRGDGTECTLTSEELKINKNVPVQISVVPKDVMFFRAEETSPTSASFVVKNGQKIILNGYKRVSQDANSANIWIGAVRHKQDMLRIKGPLSNDLIVMVRSKDPVSIRYTMAVKSEFRRGVYAWEHLDWTPCDVVCGFGSQVSTPKCVEAINGLVDDKYCLSTEKPLPMTRNCESKDCSTRWQLGDWKGCDCACGDEWDERAVECVRHEGSNEGEAVILAETDCEPPKPISMKKCICSNAAKRYIRMLEMRKQLDRVKQLLHLEKLWEQESNIDQDSDPNFDRYSHMKTLKSKKGTLIVEHDDKKNIWLNQLN